MTGGAIFAQQLSKDLLSLSWEDRLSKIAEYTSYAPVFSTSFSFEDQVITHVIARDALPIRVFTLDTGRLFEQTHDTFQKTREKYVHLKMETFYPDATGAQDLVAHQGINGFYRSVENRKSCCYVRKVEPLGRALAGAGLWISGLRREHSENREDLPLAEFDVGRNLVKFYPLIDVSVDEIRAYIDKHQIPFNILHDQGYPSIGCAPCTRAVNETEHPRAGRWWWEQEQGQECGLHMVDGKFVRTKDLPKQKDA